MRRLLLIVAFTGLAYYSLKNLLNVFSPQYILGFSVGDPNLIQMWYGCHFLAYMLAILVLIADFHILNGLCYFIFVFHFVELGALYLVLSPASAHMYLAQLGINFELEVFKEDISTMVAMIVAVAAVVNAALLYFFYAIENHLD